VGKQSDFRYTGSEGWYR